MTSPRINLAELREWAFLRGVDEPVATAVLALVEAVEAAQAVTTNPLNPDAHRRLRAALAPFVEEQT